MSAAYIVPQERAILYRLCIKALFENIENGSNINDINSFSVDFTISFAMRLQLP